MARRKPRDINQLSLRFSGARPSGSNRIVAALFAIRAFDGTAQAVDCWDDALEFICCRPAVVFASVFCFTEKDQGHSTNYQCLKMALAIRV